MAEEIKKPLEWDELMKPYRESRLFCRTINRRIMPTYTEIEVRSCLKSMGYDDDSIIKYLNESKVTLVEDRKGDDD